MLKNAKIASNFLKGLASEHRLIILCELTKGECSVTELIEATGMAQTSMSQHLKKLKDEGIVDIRRDHRILYYRIVHPTALEILQNLHNHFCPEDI